MSIQATHDVNEAARTIAAGNRKHAAELAAAGIKFDDVVLRRVPRAQKEERKAA